MACAHFGAHVLGSDIGWNIIHGKGKLGKIAISSGIQITVKLLAHLRWIAKWPTSLEGRIPPTFFPCSSSNVLKPKVTSLRAAAGTYQAAWLQ